MRESLEPPFSAPRALNPETARVVADQQESVALLVPPAPVQYPPILWRVPAIVSLRRHINDAGLVERRVQVGDGTMIHAIISAERHAKGVTDPVLAGICLRFHPVLPRRLAPGRSQRRRVHLGPEVEPADAMFMPGFHRAARR